MRAGARARINVIDAPLETEQAVRLVEGRSLLCRLRNRLRLAPESPREAGSLFWPIHLIQARAVYRPMLRRPVEVRWLGAVDGVTGRPGIAEIRVPRRLPCEVDFAQVIPDRKGQEEVINAWCAFARRFVEVRYKPIEIRELAVERMEKCYLPYRVVVASGRTYLVDCLMRRVDPLSELPELAFFFRDVEPSMASGREAREEVGEEE